MTSAHAQNAQPKPDYALRQEFVDKTFTPTVPKDPQAALTSFREFVQAHPNFNRWERILLFAHVADQLYFATPADQRAAVLDTVLGVFDEDAQFVKDNPNRIANDQAGDLMTVAEHRIKVLLDAQKNREAATALNNIWPVALSWNGPVDNWCSLWRTVYNRENKPGQAVDGLIKAYQLRLPRRAEWSADISVPICDELLKQGRDEESLSWAKQTFVMCAFDERAIKDATNAVNKCLSARELSLAKANVFAAAQTDPAATNPLEGVKLPALDTTALQAQVAEADLPSNARITCLLALGNYHDAMLLARTRLVEDVGNEDSARQVARVFKAKDADIARANLFLTYYQQGEGENPIPAFLKETATVK